MEGFSKLKDSYNLSQNEAQGFHKDCTFDNTAGKLVIFHPVPHHFNICYDETLSSSQFPRKLSPKNLL